VVLVGYASAKSVDLLKQKLPQKKSLHFVPLDRSPKTECGAILNGDFGEFSSPNYPEIYPKNLTDCGYRIVAPSTSKAIRLRFVDFSTEAGNDVVTVYDGADSTATVLATLSGTDLTENQAVITGSGNSLYVSLTTDSSVNDRGFLAQWSLACGSRYTSIKGEIHSPDYPNQYADNLDECYDITAPVGKAVRLEFAEVDTEAGVDFIRVHDGDSEAGDLLAELSGQSAGEVFVSTLSNLYVVFQSNAGGTGKGFIAYYSQLCGNRFAGPSGQVTSPGYPGNYPNNADECYLIEVADDKRILLAFDVFDTEADYDYLEVYDGASEAAPLIQTLSGSAAVADIESTGNSLYLRFVSDYSFRYDGFSATYTEI